VDVDAHLFQFGEWRSERGELPVRRFHYRKHRIVLGGCAVNVVAPAFELARQFIREAVNRIEAAESVKSAGAQVDEAKEGGKDHLLLGHQPQSDFHAFRVCKK
jgi:hypothetical protein